MIENLRNPLLQVRHTLINPYTDVQRSVLLPPQKYRQTRADIATDTTSVRKMHLSTEWRFCIGRHEKMRIESCGIYNTVDEAFCFRFYKLRTDNIMIITTDFYIRPLHDPNTFMVLCAGWRFWNSTKYYYRRYCIASCIRNKVRPLLKTCILNIWLNKRTDNKIVQLFKFFPVNTCSQIYHMMMCVYTR